MRFLVLLFLSVGWKGWYKSRSPVQSSRAGMTPEGQTLVSEGMILVRGFLCKAPGSALSKDSARKCL